MKLSLFQVVALLITMLYAVVQLIEQKTTDPGSGAEKKQMAIDALKALLPAITGIPPWLLGILSTDQVLGMFVDLVVGILNVRGWIFPKEDGILGN